MLQFLIMICNFSFLVIFELDCGYVHANYAEAEYNSCPKFLSDKNQTSAKRVSSHWRGSIEAKSGHGPTRLAQSAQA
jgi:hypothetical protein